MAKEEKKSVKITFTNLISLFGLCAITLGTIITFSSRITAMETQQVTDNEVNKIVIGQGKDLSAIKTDVGWIKQHLQQSNKE